MGANPRNVVALYEPAPNLIDTSHHPGGHVVLNDQILIDRISSPCLSAGHRRDGDFAQLARLFQAAVPLPDRSLPSPSCTRGSGDLCADLVSHGCAAKGEAHEL